MPLRKKPYENIVGKMRKCWWPALSPFSTFFTSTIAYKNVLNACIFFRLAPSAQQQGGHERARILPTGASAEAATCSETTGVPTDALRHACKSTGPSTKTTRSQQPLSWRHVLPCTESESQHQKQTPSEIDANCSYFYLYIPWLFYLFV